MNARSHQGASSSTANSAGRSRASALDRPCAHSCPRQLPQQRPAPVLPAQLDGTSPAAGASTWSRTFAWPSRRGHDLFGHWRRGKRRLHPTVVRGRHGVSAEPACPSSGRRSCDNSRPGASSICSDEASVTVRLFDHTGRAASRVSIPRRRLGSGHKPCTKHRRVCGVPSSDSAYDFAQQTVACPGISLPRSDSGDISASGMDAWRVTRRRSLVSMALRRPANEDELFDCSDEEPF